MARLRGRVEVHALSAASGNQQFHVHAATPLPVTRGDASWQFAVGSLDGSGDPDLFVFRVRGGASGRVEAHVLSARSNYQQWVLHAATVLPFVDPNGWTLLVGDSRGAGDIVAVAHARTSSGQTEVHVLRRLSTYRDFSHHSVTPLHLTSNAFFDFIVGDADRDRVPDVYAIRMNGSASGQVEVHSLSGRAGFRAWNLHSVTPWSPFALGEKQVLGWWQA